MKGFLVGATAAALMLATLLVALLPGDPPPSPSRPPALVERAPKGDRQTGFGDRWAMPAQTPIIDRTDAFAIPVPSGPALQPAHQRAPVRRELCAAHGMHRQYYRKNDWTYWRCVK